MAPSSSLDLRQSQLNVAEAAHRAALAGLDEAQAAADACACRCRAHPLAAGRSCAEGARGAAGSNTAGAIRRGGRGGGADRSRCWTCPTSI